MPRKLTISQVAERIKKVHGNKYKLSPLAEYNGYGSPVVLICPVHGEFTTTLHKCVLLKQGCPECSRHTLSYGEFCNRANQIHNSKYDYSLVDFSTTTDKIDIVCPVHGLFRQSVNNHLSGQGCPKCNISKRKGIRTSNGKRMGKDMFIQRAMEIHKGKYDYNLVEYVNQHTKVDIICPIHGVFRQTPNSHLKGCGCAKCSKRGRLTTTEFIGKAQEVHGNKYDYSKCEYVNSHKPITIICHSIGFDGKEHGEFMQTPNKHLLGRGCPKCGRKGLSDKERVEELRSIHNNRYEYMNFHYVGKDTKVTVICPIHGKFIQDYTLHRYQQCGCPKCNQSRLEKEVEMLLQSLNIGYLTLHKAKWLKYPNGQYLHLDFYLPDHNIAIECQGEQHFKPVDFIGNKSTAELSDLFTKQRERDKWKSEQCNKKDMVLLYYSTYKDAPKTMYNRPIYKTLDELKQRLTYLVNII